MEVYFESVKRRKSPTPKRRPSVPMTYFRLLLLLLIQTGVEASDCKVSERIDLTKKDLPECSGKKEIGGLIRNEDCFPIKNSVMDIFTDTCRVTVITTDQGMFKAKVDGRVRAISVRLGDNGEEFYSIPMGNEKIDIVVETTPSSSNGRVKRSLDRRMWQGAGFEWLKRNPWRYSNSNWLKKRNWADINSEWLKKRSWDEAGMDWLRRRRRSADKKAWSEAGIGWIKRSDDSDKRAWNDAGFGWVKKNAADKKAWEDAGIGWVKKNSPDKKAWEDAGIGWVKKDLNKKAWSDAGFGWVKKNASDKKAWHDAGIGWIKRNSDTENKRAWSDAGINWVKRQNEHKDAGEQRRD
ncbi:unnamed protein product [Dimorphilus gyrociliatus]|uniref:Uncharacterized protein n=1 Tax=Dimorphilus gyrociliatus TaxID=2664684 RepID=A0A7I8V9F6_9ANNE|nr:unnamed protein product [Dimorphilus gyrociliatus]